MIGANCDCVEQAVCDKMLVASPNESGRVCLAGGVQAQKIIRGRSLDLKRLWNADKPHTEERRAMVHSTVEDDKGVEREKLLPEARKQQ